MRLSTLTVLSSTCIVAGAVLALRRRGAPLAVVPDVDLQRYQGRWYEIARFPAHFERKCAGNVTAEYSLRSDGTVRVVNSCSDDSGRTRVSKGLARRRDVEGPASKLRVRFFWPFVGDYWILDLDPEYRWVLVGTPDRRYLWVLSRTPEISAQTYQRLLGKANNLGFDTERMQFTRQNTGDSRSAA